MEKMTLLLVDDESRFLETMARLLTRLEVRALTAGSGAEALERLREHEVHVVILDVKMPGMDGISTLREIRRRHPLVEVILLSGHGTEDLTVEGLRSGAFDFVTKPAGLKDLLKMAGEAYRKRIRIEQRIGDVHGEKRDSGRAG
ncbi:MAG: response regulator [Desulfobacterales bacterium]